MLWQPECLALTCFIQEIIDYSQAKKRKEKKIENTYNGIFMQSVGATLETGLGECQVKAGSQKSEDSLYTLLLATSSAYVPVQDAA